MSISRTYGGGLGTRIHISIMDETSRVEFFDGFMTVEDFGNMITGLGFQPVSFEFRPSKVGMIAENKTELVDRPISFDPKEKELQISEALKPFEVDGWVGDRGDVTNHHCWAGDKKARVRFFRHIPVS